MVARGIKRKQRAKHQTSSAKLETKRDDGPCCTYSPIHHYLFFSVIHGTKKTLTKKNPCQPASIFSV